MISFSSPSSILILPRIEFDDEGNVISISSVACNVEPRVRAVAKKEYSRLEVKGPYFLSSFIEYIKDQLCLGPFSLEASLTSDLQSLNQEVSALLSSFACSLSLFNLDFNDHMNLLEGFIIKNKLSFLLPSNLFHEGFSISSRSFMFNFDQVLNFDLADFSVLFVELGRLDIHDFLLDKWYRKVIAFHSSSCFDHFSSSLDLDSLYEANNRLAFQAGILEPELEEMMKEARELGLKFVGYNYFSKGFHCLVENSRIVAIYESLSKLLSKKEKACVLEISTTPLVKE